MFVDPGRVPADNATIKLFSRDSNEPRVDRAGEVHESHNQKVIVDAIHNGYSDAARIVDLNPIAEVVEKTMRRTLCVGKGADDSIEVVDSQRLRGSAAGEVEDGVLSAVQHPAMAYP